MSPDQVQAAEQAATAAREAARIAKQDQERLVKLGGDLETRCAAIESDAALFMCECETHEADIYAAAQTLAHMQHQITDMKVAHSAEIQQHTKEIEALHSRLSDQMEQLSKTQVDLDSLKQDLSQAAREKAQIDAELTDTHTEASRRQLPCLHMGCMLWLHVGCMLWLELAHIAALSVPYSGVSPCDICCGESPCGMTMVVNRCGICWRWLSSRLSRRNPSKPQ